MIAYQTKQERITIAGVNDLTIRSLLDQQQFFDPDGEADRLGISSAAWPMFGVLWPSGAQLAARLALHPVCAGERILEIGCGLALASLVGHRRGADVTASDWHPLAHSFLQENVRLNALPPLKYQHACWSTQRHATHDEYDLIVGSDLLYERDATAALAGFIAHHCAPAGVVWIVDPDRGNRPAFNRQMATHGFMLQEERLDRPSTANAIAYKGRLLIYRRCTPDF